MAKAASASPDIAVISSLHNLSLGTTTTIYSAQAEVKSYGNKICKRQSPRNGSTRTQILIIIKTNLHEPAVSSFKLPTSSLVLSQAIITVHYIPLLELQDYCPVTNKTKRNAFQMLDAVLKYFVKFS